MFIEQQIDFVFERGLSCEDAMEKMEKLAELYPAIILTKHQNSTNKSTMTVEVAGRDIRTTFDYRYKGKLIEDGSRTTLSGKFGFDSLTEKLTLFVSFVLVVLWPIAIIADIVPKELSENKPFLYGSIGLALITLFANRLISAKAQKDKRQHIEGFLEKVAERR